MPKTVLVVEDDASISESLGELLRDEGFLVDSAFNGDEALRRLRSGSATPDLILLDLMMPIKDGYEFRREQRADPRLSSIPVIVMTADTTAGKRIGELDIKAWIRKPLDIDKIIGLVNRHA